MTTCERQLPVTSADTVTRRVVIAGATIMAIAGGIVTGLDIDTSEAEAAVLAVLRHREVAARVGAATLTSLPHNRGTLLAQILDDLEMSVGEATRVSESEIRRKLSRRIYQDFAAGRTLKLDGWLLSVAEARLCALAALSAN